MEKFNNNPIISPYLGVFLGILAVSSASIFIKFAQQEVASIVIAGYRLGVSALILAPIVIFRHRDRLKNLTRGEGSLAFLSGILLAVHFGTWIKSLEFTTVASSVVLVTTTPLWVAILSPFTLKEPISKTVVIGLILALCGTLIIGVGDVCRVSEKLICPPINNLVEGDAFFGDILAIMGAWSAAGYVIIGRKLRKDLSLTPYIFLVYGMAAIVLITAVLFSGKAYAGFELETYIWLLLLAFIPQLIGHSAFNWALGFLPAAFIAISLLGEPIGSTVLAYVFLEESPGWLQIIGAILIFSGIFIASKTTTPSTKDVKSQVQ